MTLDFASGRNSRSIRWDPIYLVGDMTLKSITCFLGILLVASSNPTDAAVLRLQTAVASASVSLDGVGDSEQGSTLVEALDPNGSTFALADPDTGEIKVRALAAEAGALSASALGSIRFTFRAEDGAIFFPEGSFQANFDSIMSRNAVLGIETIGGTAQTVSQHQANVFGGTRGSGLGALIDVTDFVGLPFPRIIEPNPVTANSGAMVDWSAGHLTSSLSSREFVLEENRTVTFSLAFRAAAIISERGLADSDGSNTASFSLTLPEAVTLLDAPESYSWITVTTVPLPSAYLLLITGLGGCKLLSRRRRRTATSLAN